MSGARSAPGDGALITPAARPRSMPSLI